MARLKDGTLRLAEADIKSVVWELFKQKVLKRDGGFKQLFSEIHDDLRNDPTGMWHLSIENVLSNNDLI